MNAPLDVTTRKKVGNVRDQTERNLKAGAEPGRSGAQPAIQVETPHAPTRAETAPAYVPGPASVPSCKVRLKIALFFDGTGNNLEADRDTKEHSNVARLFRSHTPDDTGRGIYRAYVPGLGTYFKDIGDVGDQMGMGFGKYGEPRLEWAMKKVDKFVAEHPASTVLGLDLSVFGFSRGAALARAFALRLQKRCTRKGSTWIWNKGGFEARLVFMGLFDTVASVGLPASSGFRSLRISSGQSVDDALTLRRAASNGLEPEQEEDEEPVLGIAFGEQPGADPTVGSIDGHGSWASDLRIPEMALKCVHLVAGHEIRNSFPLDSAREGNRYPASVDERVYPGVHSNVGGGYRPGEGGRSVDPKDLLSKVPLLAMHDAAVAAGVPLLPKCHTQSQDDFEVSEGLLDRFNRYMRAAEQATPRKTVEGRMLGHMRLWNAWRFLRIRESQTNGRRKDADLLRGQETQFEADRKQLEQQVKAAEGNPERLAAQKRLADAEREVVASRRAHMEVSRMGWGADEARRQSIARIDRAEAELTASKKAYADADEPHQRLRARLRTLPSTGLLDRLALYDRHLMLDVAALQRMRKLLPKARLRPHYANLMEAYEAEFERRKGLLDTYPEVLEFFDRYVHDSLAGFALDATLPSDPRVVYIGGDEESRYASVEGMGRTEAA